MVDRFEANNTFGAHLIDSSFNFTLEYGLALDPAILKDEGHFEVFSEGLDFNAFFHPVEEELNGEKSVVIKVHDVQASLDPGKVGILLNNTNDLNQIAVTVLNTIKYPMINLMTKAVELYLQSVFSLIAAKIPHPITLENDILLNLDYLEAPII